MCKSEMAVARYTLHKNIVLCLACGLYVYDLTGWIAVISQQFLLDDYTAILPLLIASYSRPHNYSDSIIMSWLCL